GSRATRMKGPVPLELSAENVSSRLVMSCGFRDLFFSHHALLMMKMFETIEGSTGFGAVVTNSTVYSSTLRAAPDSIAYSLNDAVVYLARSNENTTSSAVNGVP